jgi:hypothetical protein
MGPTVGSHPLLELLGHWRQRLMQWSQTGALRRAAEDALMLKEEPNQLRELLGRWSSGDFRDLPPVVVVPGSAMPTASGAYAIRTGTLVLNGDWLLGASRQQALAVLSEELGHHLDALLNSRDTPGDEGELFTALLQGQEVTPALRQRLRAEDDRAWLQLG